MQETLMPTPDNSLKMFAAVLKPESRCAMLLALTTALVGAESCMETTLELTNRVYDRYFPGESGKRSQC
jgi:hypothetical protein